MSLVRLIGGSKGEAQRKQIRPTVKETFRRLEKLALIERMKDGVTEKDFVSHAG